MAGKRLDLLLCERGLAESRERAKTLIMSGDVFVNGQRSDKPGTSYPEDCEVEVRAAKQEFVSRGGYKLKKALDTFGVSPEGRLCLDVGASTGGFTDCLLQRGAAKVYSVDVGYGQLAWNIRTDPRVVVLERTNIRNATPELIPGGPSLCTIDVSFISLRLVLPVVRTLLDPSGEVLCLIKPQFEAGREKVGKKGVVRDPAVHEEVLEQFTENARVAGFTVSGITFSPIRGPEGNIEYLGHLTSGGKEYIPDLKALVAASHEEL